MERRVTLNYQEQRARDLVAIATYARQTLLMTRASSRGIAKCISNITRIESDKYVLLFLYDIQTIVTRNQMSLVAVLADMGIIVEEVPQHSFVSCLARGETDND